MVCKRRPLNHTFDLVRLILLSRVFALYWISLLFCGGLLRKPIQTRKPQDPSSQQTTLSAVEFEHPCRLVEQPATREQRQLLFGALQEPAIRLFQHFLLYFTSLAHRVHPSRKRLNVNHWKSWLHIKHYNSNQVTTSEHSKIHPM